MPDSPLKLAGDFFSFEILINGKRIEDTSEVISIEIYRSIFRIPMAKLGISLPMDQGINETFKLCDSKDLSPGQEIEIKLGYQFKRDTVFSGIISSQVIQSTNHPGSKLIISCRDKAVQLQHSSNYTQFSHQKDSDAIGAVIGEHGLGIDIDVPDFQQALVETQYGSDWVFLLSHAAANGMLLYAEDGTIRVKKPLKSGTAELGLEYGRDVLKFDCRIGLEMQASVGAASSKDLKSMKMKATKTESQLDPHLISSNKNPTGTFTFLGNASPRLNSFIEISGFGQRFNGNALITSVRHIVKEGAWETIVGIGIKPSSIKRLLERLNKPGENSGHPGGSAPAKEISRQLIKTSLGWEDFVMERSAMVQLEEIKSRLTHNDELIKNWGLKGKIKPGYLTLFSGPSGTGKTLAATLIGKSAGMDVYRINLSQIISKYIGETEKNITKLLKKAEKGQSILFFDEADALFGKRTNVKVGQDRYANQDVSYLLQRIEAYPGLVIFSSETKPDMDRAVLRRFQSIVHFPMPNAELRLQLWQKAFSGSPKLAPDVDLEAIAKDYELSGASIMNILQHVAIAAVQRKPQVVTQNDLMEGIRRELRKEAGGI